MKYTPRPITENVNVSKTSPFREFVTLTLGVLGTLLVVYILLGLALDFVVPRVSLRMEDHLSSLFAHVYENEEKASPTAESLQSILDQLVSAGDFQDRQYRIHLVSNKMVNALAFPGGHILVFSGLLEKVQSENELAMVLGHELGHYRNKDHLRGMGRGLVLVFFSTITFGASSQISGFLQSMLLKTEMKFSQKQEKEADVWGLKLIRKLYGHVGGATDFFKRLSKEDKAGRLSYFFATHPYPEDRVRELESMIKERNDPVLETRPLAPPLRQ